MENLPAQAIDRGFPVAGMDTVPAIGSTGVSQQMFCPLIKSACIKSMCMFWVELFTHQGADAKRVGHCAYYWNALQAVEIKEALNRINQNIAPKEAPDAASS